MLYINKYNKKLTVASLETSSSVAPREANPISCENWAKLGLASRGICPKSSWQQSLLTAYEQFRERSKQMKNQKQTYGSGV